MNRPGVDGLMGVKLPVTDLQISLRWYKQVFGVVTEMEFFDESGTVRGVVCSIPGMADTGISFREDPEAAQRYAGFDPFAWHVADLTAIDEWIARLDELGIDHSQVITATEGWLLTFQDPDQIGHHLYTRASHGIDRSGEPGAGRRVSR